MIIPSVIGNICPPWNQSVSKHLNCFSSSLRTQRLFRSFHQSAIIFLLRLSCFYNLWKLLFWKRDTDAADTHFPAALCRRPWTPLFTKMIYDYQIKYWCGIIQDGVSCVWLTCSRSMISAVRQCGKTHKLNNLRRLQRGEDEKKRKNHVFRAVDRIKETKRIVLGFNFHGRKKSFCIICKLKVHFVK